MDDLLYLTHRIPWPPNKGDKIRSHHVLRQLATRFHVHLGTFVDDPADAKWLPELQRVCKSVHAVPLRPGLARLRALTGLASGAPLTVPFYRDGRMRRWVERTVADYDVRRALVFSSAMAQYVNHLPDLARVVDLVDVDSEKWREYAERKPQPWRWLYAREAQRLLAFERASAAGAEACVLVSEDEAALFRRLAPESQAHTWALRNGVDATFFDPEQMLQNPYPEGVTPLVFTGAMDYWPNEDAVCHFVRTILPALVEAEPSLRFYIVGNRPTEAVRNLAENKHVCVTGFVEDVRPYLVHAIAAVAPLRVARGVQNKVLEAMAMAKPVIASAAALEGIDALAGQEVLHAESADDYLAALRHLRRGDVDGMGGSARARVLRDYSWESNLASLISVLDASVDRAELSLTPVTRQSST